MSKKKKTYSEINKFQIATVIILLFLNMIATYMLLKNVKIPWVDEAVYVSMGKYIFSNGKYGLIDPFRAFGLPLIAGITWVIGLSPLTFLKYLSIFSWFSTAVVLYFVEKKILKKINFVSLISLLFFIDFSVYYTRALTDPVSMFFSLVGFYFLLKRDFFSSGFFFGLSALIRYTGVVHFVVAIVSYFIIEVLYKRKIHLKEFLKNVTLFSLLFFIVFVPNLVLSKAYFGSYFYTILSSVKNRYEQMWYGDSDTLTHLGFIVLSPMIFSIFLVLKDERFNYEQSLTFIFVMLLMLVFFSSTVLTREKRFFMFLLPFVSVLSALGYSYFEKRFGFEILATLWVVLIFIILLRSSFYLDEIKWYKDPINLYNIYKQVGREIYVTDAKSIFTNDFHLGAYYDVSLKLFGDWKYAKGVFDQYKNSVDLAILDMCGTPCNPADKLCSSGYYKNTTIEAIKNNGFYLRTKLYYSFDNRMCEYLVFKKQE